MESKGGWSYSITKAFLSVGGTQKSRVVNFMDILPLNNCREGCVPSKLLHCWHFAEALHLMPISPSEVCEEEAGF